MNIDLVERANQCIQIDDWNARFDHLVDGHAQSVDAVRLNGDKVPSLARHFLNRSALLGIGKLAVKPRDVDSLPQYSAACLPWAHQLTCRPILEKAAFSGFSERPPTLPISAASDDEILRRPKNAAPANVDRN